MYPFARHEDDSKPNGEYLDAKIPWDEKNKLYKYNFKFLAFQID